MLTGGARFDTFILSKAGANGDIISDFVGSGAAAGDVLRLTDGGAGRTFTLLAPGVWQITDGVAGTVALVNIAGPVHVTDYIFG
ncbi:MAG: hypothetical protein RL490_1637 [Pseudomonadota bacterium]